MLDGICCVLAVVGMLAVIVDGICITHGSSQPTGYQADGKYFGCCF